LNNNFVITLPAMPSSSPGGSCFTAAFAGVCGGGGGAENSGDDPKAEADEEAEPGGELEKEAWRRGGEGKGLSVSGGELPLPPPPDPIIRFRVPPLNIA
jgi:hypothetical protein